MRNIENKTNDFTLLSELDRQSEKQTIQLALSLLGYSSTANPIRYLFNRRNAVLRLTNDWFLGCKATYDSKSYREVVRIKGTKYRYYVEDDGSTNLTRIPK